VSRRPAFVRELALLAIEVAAEAPERFTGVGSSRTYIRRRTVQRIRDVCDRAGIDWRGVKARTEEQQRAGYGPEFTT
jgi:hypothetical protein